MWPFNLFKKAKKEEKLNKKEHAKAIALKELSSLKYNKKSIKDFSTIIKDFFSEYFRFRYQFTSNELEEELKKRKIKKELKSNINSLLDEFAEKEFNTSKITKEDFKKFVEKFKKIILTLK